jgi:hypothetical protein
MHTSQYTPKCRRQQIPVYERSMTILWRSDTFHKTALRSRPEYHEWHQLDRPSCLLITTLACASHQLCDKRSLPEGATISAPARACIRACLRSCAIDSSLTILQLITIPSCPCRNTNPQHRHHSLTIRSI